MYTDMQYRKIFRAIKNGMEVNDLCDLLNLKELEMYGLVEALNIRGYDISITNANGKKIISKKNIVRTTKHIKPEIEDLNHIKICVVSDTHLCTNIQQLGLLNEVYKEAYNRKIKTFLHCGDLLDGDFTKIRPDQNYQLFKRGFDEQTMYAVEMYPYIEGAKTFFIEGSHDQTHVKNGGATPGLWISKLREDMVYLGTPEATIDLGNVKIKMQHPGGGCARSLSYKPQIAIDEMDSNDKPNIFLQGHFHKAYGGVYRNVHFWLVPSFMNQSGFMKLNNLKSIVGAYFMDIYADKKGHIEYIDVDPFIYDKNDIDENDYKNVKALKLTN